MHDRTTSRPDRPAGRRRLVAAIGLGVAATLLASVTATPSQASEPRAAAGNSTQDSTQAGSRAAKARPDARFPGHRPGRIYLGMSCGEKCGRMESKLDRPFGLKRWYKKWGNWRGVEKAIQADRRHHRLPWISIEGPDRGAATGWRAVGRGRYDGQIRALARVLKHHDKKPLFLSFDHEPSNKAPDSAGAWWAHGFNHLHDVLRARGALRHVAMVPIMAGWLFSKFNRGDNPAHWLRPGVLDRAAFVAVDVYENDKLTTYGQRLPGLIRWLGKHGHPHMMIGIGETGATNYYKGTTAARWLNKSLRWAAHHANRVAAISYFNSTAFSRPGAYWPLDESAAKLHTFRKWLASPVYINRVR